MDSLSVTPDSFVAVKHTVAEAEAVLAAGATGGTRTAQAADGTPGQPPRAA